MPSNPVLAATPAVADATMNRLRVTPPEVLGPSTSGILIDLSSSRRTALVSLSRSSAGFAGAPLPGGGSEGGQLSPRLAADRRSTRTTAPSELTFVDLLQLAVGPLHGVLGLHTLDSLGIHVGDDVLGEALRRLGGGGTGVAEQPRVAGGGAEHLERLVEVRPHGVVLPHPGGADAVAFLRGEPLPVVVLLVDPAQEVLGELLVLRVLHEGVGLVQEEEIGAGRPCGERRMPDVRVHGLALVVFDLLLLPLGHDVDAGSVQRGRDLTGVEGAVVVRVVPREPALVAAILPEGLHELHRLDGAGAVQHHLLTRLVRLRAAVGPEHGVGEGGRIAEGVAEGLAVGLALLLERREELPRLFPRLGVLA